MGLIQHNSASTAILLFAQSEKKESASKPIAYSSKQNVLLWKKMNNRVLKTIQLTKLPYFISNENDQIGSTFGEKITNSILAIFEKGFDKVIVVGNDCVQLKATFLHQAERNLQNNDWVIGSDYSGGAYLLGVTKSKFKAESFKNIPWKTKNVFTALQSLYKTQSIAYLPCLNDCNDTFDFERASYTLSFSDSFRKLLLSFLPFQKVQNNYKTHNPSFDYQALNLNKGSPLNA